MGFLASFVRWQRKRARGQALRRSSGQALVEFALLLPLLLVLLVGTIDLGRAFYGLTAVTNAAFNGAIYASITPADCTGSVGTTLRSRVTNELDLLGTTAANPTVTCTTGNDGWTYGSGTNFTYSEVAVTYAFNTIGPYGPIVPTLNIKHVVRMRAKP